MVKEKKDTKELLNELEQEMVRVENQGRITFQAV